MYKDKLCMQFIWWSPTRILSTEASKQAGRYISARYLECETVTKDAVAARRRGMVEGC